MLKDTDGHPWKVSLESHADLVNIISSTLAAYRLLF